MAINVTNLEGNELADGYVRRSVPQGRWSDAWSVFKGSFLKLVLINLFILITVVPIVVILIFRNTTIAAMGTVYPFNPGMLYPYYPNVIGLAERLSLSTDVIFYALLIPAGFIASLGFSGAAYSFRKMLNTHGEYSLKDFFHGIKVCYLNTVLPVTLFMLALYGTLLVGDWMNIEIAIGGNAGGAITAFVFAVIATVLIGIYTAWLFAVGTSYRVKFGSLFKNAFSMMIGTAIPTVFMAGFALIPVWLVLIGGFVQTIGFIVFILFGFSMVLFCWTAFTQWAMDIYVKPTLVTEKEQNVSKKNAKTAPVVDKADDERRRTGELLAAGRSELISRPIKPIAESETFVGLGKTFKRGDISAVNAARSELDKSVKAYEDAHKNDPVYVEYNKLFADRDKALKVETDKKGRKKKNISSDNLLK